MRKLNYAVTERKFTISKSTGPVVPPQGEIDHSPAQRAELGWGAMIGWAPLARLRVLVLLIEDESQSITIMKALSVGCPVVAADTTALRELAGKGWIDALPDRYTTGDVAAAIVPRLRGAQLLIGMRPPRWDDCARDLLTLYREVA